MAYKPEVIPVSFKTTDIDDMILFDWLKEKFKQYGNKSNYIKFVLREKMEEELSKND